MYNILPLILFAVLSGHYSSYAQSTDSLIKDIRKKYQAIRSSLKSYDTVFREEMEESTEGGQITGYYNKKELKHIEAIYFGETGKAEIEYYFDDGLLLFVFEKHYTYNRPVYWDKKWAQEYNDTVIFDCSKTVIREARYYFHKERMIRLMNNEKTEVDLSVEANAAVGQELISHAHNLRKKVKK